MITMTVRPTTAAAQIQLTEEYGTDAFHWGFRCAPALDNCVLHILGERQIGQTPAGEAPTVDILAAWQRGWHRANLASPVS